jgi:GTP cyclohydrolase II
MENKKMTTKKFVQYNYKNVHADLEIGKYAGSYGWDNAAYIAIAEKKAGIDLKNWHQKRSKDEFFIPSIKELIDNPATQEHWHHILTFDPYGLTSRNPTIACTNATLNLPEFKELTPDGKIMNNDNSVNCSKAAIYYAWNIPELSSKLNLSENDFRETLFKFSNDDRLNDPKINVYLPPVGGLTCYIFGDGRKIRDPLTEIAVRVHDACNGSDVFGTDICTCRPYLLFAMLGCIEVAQRGGVGIIVYFRKEGRSLGEVTKYRVYNARKHQDGGDTAEKYFFHTENIAGIRDARFQVMMPDVLNWLGVHRIDWLFSMSNEKYDALVQAGIRIYQRVPLPQHWVPKGAFVELHAKIADGYHAMEISTEEVVDKMRDLRMIREQCNRVYDLAKLDKLHHLQINEKKITKATKYVIDCIDKYHPTKNIPMHSRFRHFEEEEMSFLDKTWETSKLSQSEKVKRLIDLATVSVLIDAGAGPAWNYTKPNGEQRGRSEGLASASFQMFLSGLFSSDTAVQTRVNSIALKDLKVRDLQLGFQVSKNNPMVGLEGRTSLLNRLGRSLEAHPIFYGREVFRPGNVVDYIEEHVKDGKVSVEVIWKAIIIGLEGIWPDHVSGIQRGDVWTYSSLKIDGRAGSDLVPFHKLSQWLLLSWLEPLMKLDFEITKLDLLTPLAEYRNGGFLIDIGVIELKHEDDLERRFNVGSEIVIEWRALTICLIDRIALAVRKYYNKNEKELPLASILEGGTWRCGRLIAKEKRDGSPPLQLRSDGTVF